MCYTYDVSVRSFVINVIGCTLLYFYSPECAAFFFFVGLMQLYDAIFWKNQKENNINWITTKIAMISNHLQPIVLALCIVFLANRRLKPVSLWFTCIYAIVALIYTIYHWNDVSYTLVREKSSPSLLWEWNSASGSVLLYTLFLVTMIILLYENFDKPLNIILVAFSLLSYALGQSHMKKNSSGRFWCFFAAYLPIILVVIMALSKLCAYNIK